MNVFDEAKQEIKELIELAKYIERFDYTLLGSNVNPTNTALHKRKKAERRYCWLLKKYT